MKWFNKDARIKSLEAENAELRSQLKFYRIHDRFFNRIMSFPDLSTLMSYVKLKAELNLEIMKHIKVWHPNDMPSEVSDNEIELRQRISIFENKMDKLIEASGIISEKTNEAKGRSE